MLYEHTQSASPISNSKAYLPIEDYGLIGDLYTVALVGKNGSIDWCCIPNFDSPSVFGAILDSAKGGFFRIAPLENAGIDLKQMYLPSTNILITRFLSHAGVSEITDFMPIKHTGTALNQHHLVRAVHVARGSFSFEMTCQPAFNYARDAHAVHLSHDGVVFESGNLTLALSSSVPLEEDGRGGVHATFTLHEGQWAYFFLESSSDRGIMPHQPTQAEYEDSFLATERYWHNWLSQCRYQGRWREMVQRSALALKLLTYAPTGAIVAAPTTSLPEGIGGVRNWDYRFTWLRDSAFTLNSLLLLGFSQEAEAFMAWLMARVVELEAGGSLQPMYTIHGGHDMTEHTLDHLEGYRQSQPVRIGNGAYTQQQLDVYGEVMDALSIYNHYKDMSHTGWVHVRQQLDWLSKNWQSTDEGIWEVRGGDQHFVHSRVMSWVAFDRALRIARDRGFPAPEDAWTNIRAEIYNEIMDKGWSEEKQSFVQYYGGDAIDASALLISLTKFTGAADPRMLSTIDRIQRELTRPPHVYRYNVELAASDGLAGEEGTFSICSFWLVEALARAGRVEEAELALEQMLTYANHVGLYAEEIGPGGEALGNFPQAFTHLSLIEACASVDQALNRVVNQGG
ncbi:MAG: glycoside hydrolase family 15 protein [Chloroflexi bacterium]|nr:MAG: glycoside hydrolase family 15 protein [Chloroflexota bacterium]